MLLLYKHKLILFHGFISDETVGLEAVTWWAQVFYNGLAVSLFLNTLKILRLLVFNRHIAMMASTLSRMWRLVAAFGLQLFIMFMAYVSPGMLLFSHTELNFSSLLSSIQTLFSMSLGMLHFRDTFGHMQDNFLSKIFFLSFVVLVIFVAMNILMAIINDAYATVVQECAYTYDRELVNHIWRKMRKWWRALGGSQIASRRKHLGKPEQYIFYTKLDSFFLFYNLMSFYTFFLFHYM